MLKTKLAPWAVMTSATFVAWMVSAASGCGPSDNNNSSGGGGNAASSSSSGMGGDSTSSSSGSAGMGNSSSSTSSTSSSNSSSSGSSGTGLAGYPGGLFQGQNPWNKDVSAVPKSTTSDKIITWLNTNGGWGAGAFRI